MARTAGSTSSTSDPDRDPAAVPDGVSLGRVVGAHGLRGLLRVRGSGDQGTNLQRVPRVRLVREGGAGEAREYEVASAVPGRAGECRVALRGVTDRDAAEALAGCELLARPDDLPALPAGEFYAFQLVGCTVYETDGTRVGKVRSVLEGSGQDLLAIEDGAGEERWVPAVEPLLRRVDVSGRRIVIDAPPGLLDRGPSDRPSDRNGEPATRGRAVQEQGGERERTGESALRIDVITIFPELFEPFLRESMVGIAVREGLAAVAVHDLREFTEDRHQVVDDAPYGGGPGMVMKPEPLVRAIEAVAGPKGPARESLVVLMSPQGERLDQAKLASLAARPRLTLVCGRYEGVDQRAIDLAVDAEVSLGDYVLSGGEVPAMALIEGLVRLLPGVLGNPESLHQESFQAGLLEGPQYTRPATFRGLAVPEVLRSGDHAAVARWREARARERTRSRRPDLLDSPGRDGEPEAFDEPLNRTHPSEVES